MKRINWKNATITLLAATNIFLAIDNRQLQETEYDLRNELVTLDEEAADWYSLYKDTLNDLYMLEIEMGIYDEQPTSNTMHNPMTGKIETMLKNNHKNGNY